MEIDREKYEKITQQAQAEKKQKTAKQKDIESKWEMLNTRNRIPPQPPIFPLVQWKPPKGLKESDFMWLRTSQ